MLIFIPVTQIVDAMSDSNIKHTQADDTMDGNRGGRLGLMIVWNDERLLAVLGKEVGLGSVSYVIYFIATVIAWW